MPRLRPLALVVVLSTPLAGCSNADPAQAGAAGRQAKQVSVVAVQRDAVRRAVDVVGTLAAVDQVTISSEADGKVQRDPRRSRRSREGRAGARSSSTTRSSSTAFEQQQAALARALAQYGATDPQHLPDIEKTPDVQKANAELVQATQAFDRASELFKRTLIAAAGARRCRRPRCRSKQASYDVALQNAKNLRASIQASEATMKLADRQLRDTEIRAPFDGYVEKRLVNLGELVKAQMPVMAIVRLDPLKVIAEIPEKMAPWINDGQPVELRVDAYPDRTFTGKVSRISPAVNTATRAFPFEALVPNADARAEAGHVRPRAHRERQGRRRPDAAVRGAAVPLRRQPRVRRRTATSWRCAS